MHLGLRRLDTPDMHAMGVRRVEGGDVGGHPLMVCRYMSSPPATQQQQQAQPQQPQAHIHHMPMQVSYKIEYMIRL
jgi:hypothetical protein